MIVNLLLKLETLKFVFLGKIEIFLYSYVKPLGDLAVYIFTVGLF